MSTPRLDLANGQKYNAALHTFDSLTDAAAELYQYTHSDTLQSLTRKERASYTRASDDFTDMLQDRLADAGVPAALAWDVVAWCRKNP